MPELAEEGAEFALPISLDGPARFRRIASIGPAYEVLEERGEFLRVRVVEDGVEFDYRRCDAELDPLVEPRQC